MLQSRVIVKASTLAHQWAPPEQIPDGVESAQWGTCRGECMCAKSHLQAPREERDAAQEPNQMCWQAGDYLHDKDWKYFPRNAFSCCSSLLSRRTFSPRNLVLSWNPGFFFFSFLIFFSSNGLKDASCEGISVWPNAPQKQTCYTVCALWFFFFRCLHSQTHGVTEWKIHTRTSFWKVWTLPGFNQNAKTHSLILHTPMKNLAYLI